MKKSSIIGGLLVLLGILIFVVTMSFSNWDFSKISTRPPFEEKEYTTKNTNQSIVIRDNNVSIFVELSSDEDIHIVYFEREKEYYEIDDKGAIKFEKETDYQWYDMFFVMDWNMPSVTIYLPQQYSGSLDLSTSNAGVSINEIIAKEIDITTDNAKVQVENISAAENVSLRTSNSRVTVENADIKGDLSIDTDNGGVTVSDTSANNISAYTKNGKIYADNVQASQSVSLESSNSSIEIRDLLSGENINMRTDNGSIHGNILGKMQDYSISAKTSNAKSNLPESVKGGNKILEIKTSNASINIDFEE